MPQLGAMQFLESWLPPALVDTLLFFSIQPHYEGLQRGVLDLRDIIYFASFIIYGLLCSIVILRCRKAAHRHNGLLTAAGIAVFSIILLLSNFLARGINKRYDLSGDQLYTLTGSTAAVLNELESPVSVRFYFSRSDKDQSIDNKAFAQRIEDLLKEYRALSGRKISYRILDPKPGSIEEKSALLDGIEPMKTARGDRYFGISLSYRDSIQTIPLLDKEQGDVLEYYLTDLFRKAMSLGRPQVGIMTDLPVTEQQANPMAGQYESRPAWGVIEGMRKDYDLRLIGEQYRDWGQDPQTGGNALDLVIVMQYKPLTEAASYALDQYLLRGGKAIIFTDALPLVGQLADPNFRFRKDQLPYLGTALGVTEAWGISYQSSKLVYDDSLATQIKDGKSGLMLTLEGARLNRGHKALRYVNKLIFPYTGHFIYREKEGVKVTPLLSSSGGASLVDVLDFSDEKKNKEAAALGKELPLALLVEGFLPSFYKGEPLTQGALTQARGESQVVLMGDLDILKDSYTFTQVKKFQGHETIRISDNTEMLLNQVDSMLSKADMIEVRMRREKKRELDYLKEFRKGVIKKFSDEIKALQVEHSKLDVKRKEFHRKQDNQVTLRDSERNELASAEERLDEISKRLEVISHQLKAAEEREKQRIVLLNTLAVPFLIVLFGIAITFYRKRRVRRS
jgi:ABC-type uncharacterized transport system involved in gliding motility auxiliary subunit